MSFIRNFVFRPVATPKLTHKQGNLTGTPRKVKDLCASIYNGIQKWNELILKGMPIVKEVTEMKLTALRYMFLILPLKLSPYYLWFIFVIHLYCDTIWMPYEYANYLSWVPTRAWLVCFTKIWSPGHIPTSTVAINCYAAIYWQNYVSYVDDTVVKYVLVVLHIG